MLSSYYEQVKCKMCDKVFFRNKGSNKKNMPKGVRKKNEITCSKKCSRANSEYHRAHRKKKIIVDD